MRITALRADAKPLRGVGYYRLKQLDLDGTFTYSQIVSVKAGKPDLYVYPNPVTDGVLHIDAAGLREETVANVYSLTGREIPGKILNGTILDVRDLASGVYVLRLATANPLPLPSS